MSPLQYPKTWIPYENTKDCSQGFCSIYCPQWCYIVYSYTPPPPSLQYHDNDSKSNVSPLVISFLGILATAFLLLSYYTLISKYCGHRVSTRRNSTDPVDDSQRNRRENHQVSNFGLDEALIKSMAVFKYKKRETFVGVSDCSVCLSEFQDDESVRILPNCNHVFHVSCIDKWLKSNSSCPLCRSNIFTLNNVSTFEVQDVVIELPLRNETFSQDEQIVVGSGNELRGVEIAMMMNHGGGGDSKHAFRAFSDLQGRERVIEIRDEVCESIIGRSISLDHSFSIGDVLNMNENENEDSYEEGCSMDVVGSSKRLRGESNKSRYKRRMLHCVMSPIAMKRSFSNGRFSFSKRKIRQGIMPL